MPKHVTKFAWKLKSESRKANRVGKIKKFVIMEDDLITKQLKIKRDIAKWISLSIILVVLITLGFLIGCPRYNVYQQRMDGQAVLAHAQSSREVAVAEAKAKMESATLLAQADTIRAHGIARSNKIIGASLTQEYLHWFWLDGLEKSQNAIIYIPTEANIPIMESTRLIKAELLKANEKK